EHNVVGIGARAAAGLDDDGRVHRVCRLQDRQTLLHIVDVEGRHAVAVLGGVIEKLSQGNAGHRLYRFLSGIPSRLRRAATPGSVFPSIHSRNAPPAVETKVKSSTTPAALRAATVSP